MEEILKELSNMDEFNSKKEENLSNQQTIKEEKKQLEELHKKLELTLLGSNDRKIAQKNYDDKKTEIESKENEASENTKKVIEAFEEQKARTIEVIDLEMNKYKKKEEIDALISQRNAYAKMAENSKKGIEKMIADINEGKDIDHSFSLKMERESLQVNSKKAEELDTEIKGYKVLEDNEKTFSDLTYLRARIQGMRFDNLKSFKEDPFLKEYGKELLEKEQLEMEEFKKQLEEAQQRKEEREEKIKSMSNEEFAKWYTGDPNKEINFEKQEKFDPEKIKNMDKDEFKKYYTGKKEENNIVTPISNTQRTVNDAKREDRKISIKFNAKKGCFITQDEEDLKTGKKQEIYVNEISTEDREKLKQYIVRQYSLDNKAIQKIDMNVAAILCVYDKNKESNKLEKYIEVLSKENKEPAKSKLRDNGITISYDMRGLYKNKQLEKQDKRELMSFANASKESGVSEVKKDIRTSIYEKIDSLFQKFENRKTKKIESPKTVKEEDKLRFAYKVSEEDLDKENQNKEKTEMEKATEEIVKGVEEVMQKGEDR